MARTVRMDEVVDVPCGVVVALAIKTVIERAEEMAAGLEGGPMTGSEALRAFAAYLRGCRGSVLEDLA